MSALSAAAPVAVPASTPRPLSATDAGVAVRDATIADAPAIHALIVEHLEEGHLLPRTLDEIERHAHRFLVAARDGRPVACGELAPLSAEVSEIRSLVVGSDVRHLGVGADLVGRLAQRAAARGVGKLCAFTHRPAYFVRHGFSIVPHVWLPEKIVTDCHRCPRFRRCGQYAVVRMLGRRERG